MRQYSYGRDEGLYDALVEGDDGREKVAGPIGGAVGGALVGGLGGYLAGDERGAAMGALGGAGVGAGASLLMRGAGLRGIAKKKEVMFRDTEDRVKDLLTKKELSAEDVMKARGARSADKFKELTKEELAGGGTYRRYSDVSYKGKGTGEYASTVGKRKTTTKGVEYDDIPDAARMSMIYGEPVLEGTRTLTDEAAKELGRKGLHRMIGGGALAAGAAGAGIIGYNAGGREKRARLKRSLARLQ